MGHTACVYRVCTAYVHHAIDLCGSICGEPRRLVTCGSWVLTHIGFTPINSVIVLQCLHRCPVCAFQHIRHDIRTARVSGLIPVTCVLLWCTRLASFGAFDVEDVFGHCDTTTKWGRYTLDRVYPVEDNLNRVYIYHLVGPVSSGWIWTKAVYYY
jgi:hypothetical protein